MKKRLIDLCLPIISVAVFLLIAEGILWAVGFEPSMKRHGVEIPFWARNAGTFQRALEDVVLRTRKLTDDVSAYQDDFTLFYRLRPNMDISVSFYDVSGKSLKNSFPDWILATDDHGHRCLPHDPMRGNGASAKKTIDIAVMGGSSLFGWGTDYENTSAAGIGIRLNADHDDVDYRVTNYAVPGYAMSQQLHLLERIVRQSRKPEWIVLDATSNCDVTSAVTDKVREKNRFSVFGRLRYWLGKLKLFNLMEKLLMHIKPEDEPKPQLQQARRIPITQYPTYVQDFIELARKNDIRLVVVGMCAGRQYVETLKTIAQRENVPMVDFYDLVEQAVSVPGAIPFGPGEEAMYRKIYPEALLKARPSFYLTFPDECHPNPTGHRLLAARLAAIIDDTIGTQVKEENGFGIRN